MNRRIKLIVTGDVEHIALRESLRRWFPEQIARTQVEWLIPRKVSGTTTSTLRDPKQGIHSSMLKLARALVAEIWDGSDREGRPADLVVALDDLELANQHQPTRPRRVRARDLTRPPQGPPRPRATQPLI